MKRLWVSLVIATLALVTIGAPRASDAQIGQLIKQRAAKKASERKDKMDSTLVHAADKAVDSTLEKSGRGVDTVVSKGSVAFDTVLNRTGSAVSSAGKALTGGGGSSDHIAADLASGRAVIKSIQFAADSDEPTPASDGVLKSLAKALMATQGPYLIEGHVDPGSDPGAAQGVSQRRAAAVKARLVALGVPEGRLFAMGFGATRPATGNASATTGNARIEVAKMQ
ncbi:MAG TPA: OmpA family protein [Gemmatimonadaceae bacterium]|nr:OmpA family protein [Gemmatimonadaceae bacterium]